MRDNADAILLSQMLKWHQPNYLHAFSDAMNSYYSEIIGRNRYTAYEADGLDYPSKELLAVSIQDKMNSFGTGFPGAGLLELADDSTNKERQACCWALAGYLFNQSI